MKSKIILRAVAVFFTLIFMVYDLRIWIPHIEYQINKKYIAEVLCENKDKPEMKCNGKCHLKKQIKKAQEQEQQPERQIIQKNDVFFIEAFDIKRITHNQITISGTAYTFSYKYMFADSVFKPPPATAYI